MSLLTLGKTGENSIDEVAKAALKTGLGSQEIQKMIQSGVQPVYCTYGPSLLLVVVDNEKGTLVLLMRVFF
ncbi:hypothetical protein [Maridesulfovibrio ferrireducens]|uniref:hypothetical protein n=1 Tax=Maridesulfovibrio ferrireducens TaxID=246191 RepID=UPI000B84AE54|nr:hypothetical protein [Maridesulfovibrio ferrireducens]